MGGASGIGKTTIMSLLDVTVLDISTLSSSQKINEFCVNNFGKSIMQATDKEIIIASREVLKLAIRGEKPVTVVDSHYVKVNTNGGISRLTTPENMIMFTSHVIIDAPASEILIRRMKDKNRNRSLSINSIDLEIKEELLEAKRISKLTSTNLNVIQNIDIVKAVDELTDILRKITRG
jgi:adenylate kinase